METEFIDKSKQWLIYMCLYFVFVLNAMNLLFNTIEDQFTLSVLIGSFFTLTVLRHLFIKYALIKYLFPVLELLLLFSIHYIDSSNNSIFLLVIIVADVFITYAYSYSITFSVVGYVIIMMTYLMKLTVWDQDLISQYVSVSLGTYASINIIFFIMKNQLIQNYKYKQLMEQLLKKTQEAEELAIFKERSRIAGEIHDTVGHTLTTVLIEIEAGRMLIDKNPVLAKEKIAIAKEQVRKGLNDIRKSVKAIKEDQNLLTFKESVSALFSETERSTGCAIESTIQFEANLLPIQEKVLYHGIQEALTNGLRHGKADTFKVQIIERKETLEVRIEDNGIGAEEMTQGFGLRNMSERVKGLGGEIHYENQSPKGFRLLIRIPVGGDIDGKN